MKHMLLSLLVILSLLVAPLEHAAGWDGDGADCQTTESLQQHTSQDDASDHSKTSKAAHHCCVTHVSARLDAPMMDMRSLSSEENAFLFQNEHSTSLVLGPPLQPPSHA